MSVRSSSVAWRPDGQELAVTRMDDCGGKTGDIVGVDPANPAAQIPLAVGAGSDPAWQPIDLWPAPGEKAKKAVEPHREVVL